MIGASLVDGVWTNRLAVDDRGLAYGDGVFETLWVDGGRPRLWAFHQARLEEGCRRLALPLPDAALLREEIGLLTHALPQAAVRLSLTRGSGPRGYAPPTPPVVRRILSAAPMPAQAPPGAGLQLRTCAMRWAIQPRLAGIKHLNRLEQVLARAEWSDPQIGEGIMLDMDGRVVSATAANLFAVIDGRCLTPPLERCGVAGTARAWLLARFPAMVVADFRPEDLAGASEIFLSSSLRGVLPVVALDGRAFAAGPWTRQACEAWRMMAAEARSRPEGGGDE